MGLDFRIDRELFDISGVFGVDHVPMLILLFLSLQAPAPFPQLVDRYYQEWAARKPVTATELGWHDHDAEIGDFSQAGIQQMITWLHGWQKKWSEVDAKKLSPGEQLDLEALKG